MTNVTYADMCELGPWREPTVDWHKPYEWGFYPRRIYWSKWSEINTQPEMERMMMSNVGFVVSRAENGWAIQYNNRLWVAENIERARNRVSEVMVCIQEEEEQIHRDGDNNE